MNKIVKTVVCVVGMGAAGIISYSMMNKKIRKKADELKDTMIEEATRERFIYPYMEQSSYSTVDFVKRAIIYFGYAPDTIQTDNGGEFTHTSQTQKKHPFDIFCEHYSITHKLIRPRTPWHNGKVERSHRNDQERFYNYLRFYSYKDLLIQMQRYLRRSNHIPMQVLGWISPIQKRAQLETI